MSYKICHFSSAHDQLDDRIFLKECISLKEAGYEVSFVARGENRTVSGVSIVGCGKPKNRVDRMVFFSRRVYKKALELDCDIYHFHDPELLYYGLKLKKKGKKVIFDSHENVPGQILSKEWIPLFFRNIVSKLYKLYESYVARRIDAVVTATDYIAKCFEGRAKRVTVVKNYPRLDEIKFHNMEFSKRARNICYVGGISEIRGEKIMLEVIKGLDADLIIAGEHDVLEINNGKRIIKYIGQIGRKEVDDLYGKSCIGLCLLLPVPNYIDSIPIKLFEYMAAGIPFVASNFPLWEKIARDSNAGICVDVNDIYAIRKEIELLLNSNERMQKMGINGRRYVEKYCNWNNEKKELISLYDDLK